MEEATIETAKVRMIHHKKPSLVDWPWQPEELSRTNDKPIFRRRLRVVRSTSDRSSAARNVVNCRASLEDSGPKSYKSYDYMGDQLVAMKAKNDPLADSSINHTLLIRQHSHNSSISSHISDNYGTGKRL